MSRLRELLRNMVPWRRGPHHRCLPFYLPRVKFNMLQLYTRHSQFNHQNTLQGINCQFPLLITIDIRRRQPALRRGGTYLSGGLLPLLWLVLRSAEAEELIWDGDNSDTEGTEEIQMPRGREQVRRGSFPTILAPASTKRTTPASIPRTPSRPGPGRNARDWLPAGQPRWQDALVTCP